MGMGDRSRVMDRLARIREGMNASRAQETHFFGELWNRNAGKQPSKWSNFFW